LGTTRLHNSFKALRASMKSSNARTSWFLPTGNLKPNLSRN